MSFTNAMKGLFSVLDTGTYPMFVGLRQATQATPCIVFEVTNAELMTMHRFPATPADRKELWQVTVEIACIADTVDAVSAMVDDQFLALTSNPPLTGQGFAAILNAFSVTMTTETPDDGQSDAERIGTITATIQLVES
jgi:hypothetical protein